MRGIVIVLVAACASRAPVAPPIANSVPGWSEQCAKLVEGSVHVDATGVDRLVVPVDDTLRACWRAAFQVVNERRERVIAPSCRALRFAEPPPTEAWLARCRRYEVVVPTPHVARQARQPDNDRPFLARRLLVIDLDQEPISFERKRQTIQLRPAACAGEACPVFDTTVDAPTLPPYDLTPVAKHVCDAVVDVVTHFPMRPSPQLPLVVDSRWTDQSWSIAWPPDSTIAPVEDALATCLAGWTATAVDTLGRALRWSKAQFVVELVTSPERRLSISKQ